jgi:hypothetical protein
MTFDNLNYLYTLHSWSHRTLQDTQNILLPLGGEFYFKGSLYRVVEYGVSRSPDDEDNELIVEVVCDQIYENSDILKSIKRDLKLRNILQDDCD